MRTGFLIYMCDPRDHTWGIYPWGSSLGNSYTARQGTAGCRLILKLKFAWCHLGSCGVGMAGPYLRGLWLKWSFLVEGRELCSNRSVTILWKLLVSAKIAVSWPLWGAQCSIHVM